MAVAWEKLLAMAVEKGQGRVLKEKMATDGSWLHHGKISEIFGELGANRDLSNPSSAALRRAMKNLAVYLKVGNLQDSDSGLTRF